LRILYVTYDGLTSLLGQSQVWPYIRGLSGMGHRFDLISFEQDDRHARIGAAVADETNVHGVAWHPRRFRAKPPVLAKILDHRDMLAAARGLARGGAIDAVHARSYVAADVAQRLKREIGLPWIFDMRGFWVDERLDGGRWPQSNPFHRHLYRRWKAKEQGFVADADRIVVLTEAARDEIATWSGYRGQPVSVIPCSVDHDVFDISTPKDRTQARAELEVGGDAVVLSYLGSIGTVYLLHQMLVLFARLKAARPGARFLLIGWHDLQAVLAEAAGLDISADDLIVQHSEHAQVPYWLGAADLAIALRRPSYSSLGASPTKLAEYLACGLPVVVNDRVGDVARIVTRLEAGAVLREMTESEMDSVVAGLDQLLAIDRTALRARSRALHDLPAALAAYGAVYDGLAP